MVSADFDSSIIACKFRWTLEYQQLIDKVFKKNASICCDQEKNSYTLYYRYWNGHRGTDLIDYCQKKGSNPSTWTITEQTYYFDWIRGCCLCCSSSSSISLLF
jgi:hypothetical protein